MPSLKETKRRIASVQSTQKITRAMKLVASAKYARANQQVLKNKPYLAAMRGALACFDAELLSQNPLCQQQTAAADAKVLAIVLTPDRGLCGGLNANLLKLMASIEKEHGNVEFCCWGKRGMLFAKKREFSFVDQGSIDPPCYHEVQGRLGAVFAGYRSGKYSKVILVYAQFGSALVQTPEAVTFLPVATGDFEFSERPVEWEPKDASTLEEVLTSYLQGLGFAYLLEASSSEHAARMTAMDSATSNADKVIKQLTLEKNRVRQAAITKELIEITSGADALHG